MVEIYDDHEQSERVREWIKENGAAIVMGVVLAIGGLYGWKFWQSHEQEQHKQVASEFLQLTGTLGESRFDQAYAHYETIKTDFPKSTYAPMASLLIARARLNQGQIDLAEKEYRQLLESKTSTPEFIQLIAAERLARVLLEQGQLDAAKTLLQEYTKPNTFASRFAEVRGDLLAMEGDNEGARKAYQEALDTMQEGTGDRSMLELKRDNPSRISGDKPES